LLKITLNQRRTLRKIGANYDCLSYGRNIAFEIHLKKMTPIEPFLVRKVIFLKSISALVFISCHFL
jgi:hypothetical protein